MPSPTELVLAAARKLDLLGAGDRLIPLDSLAIIDMVLELEAATRIKIPTASLREEAFQSVETIAAMLVDLSA